MKSDTPRHGDAGRLRHLWPFLEQEWLRVVLLVLFGFAARFPALHGGLIWDDTHLTRDNPFIKSPLLMLETFRHSLFPEASSGHYRPVQNISYSFDYLIWNTDTFGYHLSNVLLHVGCSVLLYLLLRQLLTTLVRPKEGEGPVPLGTETRLLSAAAFIGALLWSVHPVHSAAVDYISGRADSLAFFFACGAWLLYLRARRVRRPAVSHLLYGAAFVACFLALCSRESAAIWMLLFLLYTFAFDKFGTWRRRWLLLGGCIAIMACYAVVRTLPAQATVAATAPVGAPASERAVLMLRALGDYSRLLVFPSNLHVERTVETPPMPPAESWRQSVAREHLSIIGLVGGAALCFAAARRGKAQQVRIFGALWFVVAYLPISNLITLNATVAEHWLYLPSVGFFLVLIGFALELSLRSQRLAVAVACLALLALTARSFVRSGEWQTPERFYRSALAAGAAKTRMALNLAQIYASEGNFAKAEPLLRKVVEMNPDYPMAQNALGHLLMSQGRREEAEAVFEIARKLGEQMRQEQPRTWIAALNTASMSYLRDDPAAALATLAKARADYPGTWPLINFEAEILRASNRSAAAVPLVEEFARQNWWHADAALTLGRLYLELGRFAEAESILRHAGRLDVHSPDALNAMAWLRLRQDRLADAYKEQRGAIAKQPDDPRQYKMLADILERMGRTHEAQSVLAHVSRLEAAAPPAVASNFR